MMCHKAISGLGLLLLLCACGTDVERTLGSSGGIVDPNQVIAPRMDPASGTFDASILVTVTTATEGAEIYCTQDGSEPTTGSILYTQAILVSRTTWLRCRGFRFEMTPSAITDGVFIIRGSEPAYPVAPLQMSPGEGTYEPPLEVTVTTATPGARIHCTQDGSEPTDLSPLYTAPIEIGQTTTLRCRGYREGLNPSAVATADYVIAGGPDPDLYQVVPIEIEFTVDGTDAIWVLDGVMDLVHVSLLAAENPQVTIWHPDGGVQVIEEWELSPYHEETGIQCSWGSAPAADCVSEPLDLALTGFVRGQEAFVTSVERVVGRGSIALGENGEIVIEDGASGRSFYWIAFEYWYRKSDI